MLWGATFIFFPILLVPEVSRVSLCCVPLKKSNKYIFVGGILNKRASKLEKDTGKNLPYIVRSLESSLLY